MKYSQYRGTGVALVTPFKNGEVDYDAIAKLVEHVIDGGVDYLVPLGSTGEAAMLSLDECQAVLRKVIEVNQGRKPVVAGNFGDNNTRRLCKHVKDFDLTGVDALLSASPAYVKPTQEAIFEHYMAFEEASTRPIILYNVPGRTSSNMDWSTTVKLAAESDKFIGIKEASGDMSQITKIIHHRPDDFLVISGDDELALSIAASGGDGLISVVANAYTRQFSSLVRSAIEDDLVTARQQHFNILDLHQWLYVEGNPVGIKATLSELGICSDEVRQPLRSMTPDTYIMLKEEMSKVQ